LNNRSAVIDVIQLIKIYNFLQHQTETLDQISNLGSVNKKAVLNLLYLTCSNNKHCEPVCGMQIFEFEFENCKAPPPSSKDNNRK
jgi:hypothetical protein